jgi:hypothetical protein
MSRLNLRTLSVFQWFGILGGAVVWTGQHVVGYGIGQATCSAGGMHWHIGFDVWQLTLLACSALLVVLSGAAAAIVFMRTRGADWGDGPPQEGRWEAKTPYGRLHFFATAALLANLLFLTIIFLDGLFSTWDTLCRQS